MKLPPRRPLLYLSRIKVTLGFAVALAATAASDAAEIKVLTSRAMNHVLTELAGAFQGRSERKVALMLAPPSEIRMRIANDETVDGRRRARARSMAPQGRGLSGFEIGHQFILVGACTGRSLGFSPLRTRST
jgi:hypothetical protein